MIDNVGSLSLEPLKVLGVGHYDFGEAIGMGDDVHADGFAHGVQEVDDRL